MLYGNKTNLLTVANYQTSLNLWLWLTVSIQQKNKRRFIDNVCEDISMSFGCIWTSFKWRLWRRLNGVINVVFRAVGHAMQNLIKSLDKLILKNCTEGWRLPVMLLLHSDFHKFISRSRQPKFHTSQIWIPQIFWWS